MYFSTKWCGPCKMFSPIVQEVCSAMGVNLQKIDAEENRDLANQYQITGVPTLILMKDDQLKFRNTGVIPKSQLINTIEKWK